MGLENPLHLLIIAVIIVLLFGAKRLPELGRSLGTGMREFKSSVTGENEDDSKPAVVEASATPAEAPVAPAPPTAAPVAAATPPTNDSANAAFGE
jgi:sec-independent protein translocase protein TatA